MKPIFSSFLTSIFSIFIVSNAFGQEVYSLSPSMKVMGLGGCATSVDGDISTVHSNPAGLAQLKGLDVYFANYSSKQFNENLGNNFFGIGYNSNKKISFGMNFQADKNNPLFRNTTNTFLTLTGAYKFQNNLSIGLNLNTSNGYSHNYLNDKISKESLDLGILKKISIRKTTAFTDYLNIGFSIKNVNPVQLLAYYFKPEQSSNRFGEIYLINNLGINYQFEYDNKIIHQNLKTLAGIILIDTRFYLSEVEVMNIYNCGLELTFLEVFSPRIGYVIQKDYVHINYGFGLHLPIYKLYKVPVNIHLDYGTSTMNSSNAFLNNYNNGVSLRVNWLLK